MTIAADMDPALTEIARVRAMLVQGMTGAAVAERLGAALDVIEDARLRVLALEGGPVPAFWRKRPEPPVLPAGVVDLDAIRARRIGAGAADPVA